MLKMWEMYKLYRTKRQKLIDDIRFDTYKNLKSSDIMTFELHIPLTNEEVARYLFIGADRFYNNNAYGAKFDLIGYVDRKQIRHCTFKEFRTIYNDTILTATHKPQ